MTLIWAAAVAAAVMPTFALTAVFPARAAANTAVTVTTTADVSQAGDGKCSLREATLYANQPGQVEPDCAAAPASGTTTIIVPAGRYTLGGQPLTLTGSATITGAGASATTITAAGGSQVFVIMAEAHVAVSDVTVTGGVSGQSLLGVNAVSGGGIANEGTLALTRVIVTGNQTSPGAVNLGCTGANGCFGGDGGAGGGISNGGTLTIANSAIIGNSTGGGARGTDGTDPASSTGAAGSGGAGGSGGGGGGISNVATLTITNSTVADNTTGAGADGGRGGGLESSRDTPGDGGRGGDGGSGGGIENSGRLVISGTTIRGNRTGTGGNGAIAGKTTRLGIGGLGGAGGAGGAVDSSADMTLSNSTIVDNSTSAAGSGGIGFGGQSGSLPPGEGGGIEQRAMGSTLAHVTIASNTAPGAGGGIEGDGGTVSVGNSIIASNQAGLGQNCGGVLVDQGGNVEFGAASCPGGFLHADPRLTALTDNGGPTQTVALQAGSSAIHRVRTCVLGTDQRGVGRPVGAACDSGAYQVAPPSVGGISAGAVTTASATIAAAVNPNLQGTTVVVNYGTTPSYGSSTAPQALGAGNAPAPFAAALAGLQPGTTYHFAVVARNADGTTTSSDGVFTTLPPLTASITRATTTGPTLSLTIACGGGFGPGSCAGAIRLTARLPAKNAHTSRVKRRPGPRAKAFTVAAGAYSVPSGGHVTVKLRLNRKGRAMLTQHYVLASTLSLGGTTPVTGNVTFRYPRIKPKVTPISYTFRFNPDGTSTLTELTVTGIPRGGKATVICRGGGCPYARRTFAPRHGRLILAPAFKHSLRPGATVTLEVKAANRVGEVKALTIGSSQQLIARNECLPPGVNQATRCATQ